MSKKYTPEKIKKNRTFPTGNTVGLVFCILLQVAAILFAVFYTPQPQDVIKDYTVTVTPLEDGRLDIEYSFVWQALDTTEPLTWVEIGMPNRNYTVYEASLSDNISRHLRVVDGDYVALRLDFTRPYKGGETLDFSFKITQNDMLCSTQGGYFYEFVPGWFNETPIEHYTFRWKQSDGIRFAEGARSNGIGYYVWSGSLDCGGYQKMYVGYDEDSFVSAQTVKHIPFDDDGAYNGLREEKGGIIALVVVAVIVMIIFEVYIIDSYVSYSRGRGFLVGYGHRVHVYGRTNPHYVSARNKYNSSRSGGGGGRGCACACACACAGGGRAGCSRKNGFSFKKTDSDK